MLVDYERAWFRLKRVIGEKRSHGQRDLALAMANLEVECMLDHDEPPPESLEYQKQNHRPLPSTAASVESMSNGHNPLLAKEARNGESKEHQADAIR